MVLATAATVPTFTGMPLAHPDPVFDWGTDVDDPRILVADDDEDVRDLMTFKLERERPTERSSPRPPSRSTTRR